MILESKTFELTIPELYEVKMKLAIMYANGNINEDFLNKSTKAIDLIIATKKELRDYNVTKEN